MTASLLNPLRWSQQRIVRQSTPLRTRQAARLDIVIILTNPPMRIIYLKSLKSVGINLVSRAEKSRLQSLSSSEPLGRVVLKESCEKLVSFRAEGGERGVGVRSAAGGGGWVGAGGGTCGGGGVAAVRGGSWGGLVDGAVVPLFQV